MSDSVLELGDKLHIITRRLFESDVRRHFVGEVTRIASELQRVRGYAFVFSPGLNEYQRLPELRSRIFSVGQDGLIVNMLPRDVVIESLSYRVVEERLVVTDGRQFKLDINEFGAAR